MAEYPHVPGFTVSINDGSLYSNIALGATTEPILILGPAPAGPTTTPTFVANEQTLVQFASSATELYGTPQSINMLTAAWRQVVDAGCNNIYLMRLEGTNTHDICISFIKALDMLKDFELAQHLVVVGLYSNDTVTATLADVSEGGGLYQVAKDDNNTLYAEDDTVNILYHLNKFIKDQIANGIEILGYIGAKPLGKSNPSLTEIRTHIDGLPDLGDSYSGFLSVVGGVDLIFNCGFDYIDNGVAAYAGLVSTLPPHSATTNKVLPGAKLIYRPTFAMLEELGDKKYVTFRRKNANVTVTLDISAAPDSSDFILLNTARIILAAIRLTRTTCDPFIGEGADMVNINAMETALKQAYNSMKANGAIVDARFTIVMSQADYLLGSSTINLEIVPVIERRKIKLNITAQAQ